MLKDSWRNLGFANENDFFYISNDSGLMNKDAISIFLKSNFTSATAMFNYTTAALSESS